MEAEFPLEKVSKDVKESSGSPSSLEKDPHLVWHTSAAPSPITYYKTSDRSVIDIRNPHLSTVLAADQLHAKQSDRSVKHLSFDFSQVAGLQNASYNAGDYLGVYPENPEALVQELADYLALDLNAKFELTETGLKEVANKLPFFFPKPCTIHDALKYYCDLSKLPRRSLVATMKQHASGGDLELLQSLLASVRSLL